MNQPDRYERFVLPPGERKVVYERDKIPGAGTFTFSREDHTLGNLLRMQLLQDKNVLFAGYRIPHPLEHKMLVRVQTLKREEDKEGKDADSKERERKKRDDLPGPDDAMSMAIGALLSEVTEVQAKVQAELDRVAQARGSMDGGGMDRVDSYGPR